jgi:hypothetical protein
MSRLVVDPAQQQPSEPLQLEAPDGRDQGKPGRPVSGKGGVVVVTPASSRELLQVVWLLPRTVRREPTARLLFRKLATSLDLKNVQLAKQGAELQVHRVHAAETRARKRRKVENEDLNAKFSRTADVLRTRREMDAQDA